MRDYAHSGNIIPEHYHSHYYSHYYLQPGWNCHHLVHIQSRHNRHADRTHTTVLSQCQCATELTLHQLVPLAHIQSRTSHSIVTTRQYKIQSACSRTGTASSGSHPYRRRCLRNGTRLAALQHPRPAVSQCAPILPPGFSCRHPLRNGRIIPVQWPASGRVPVRSARCAPRAATTAAGRRPRISVGV